jgi:hypothetical protein
MNYLQLGQRLATECGATNVTLNSMLNQQGEQQRFVNWVNTSWNELQTLHDDWEWMRSSSLLGQGVSFVPDPGQASIPLGTGPGTIGLDPLLFGGKWAKASFRNYTTSVGPRSEIFMTDIRYDFWRDAYMYGANRDVKTRPVALAIGPDKSLCIGPPSNGQYTVTGDYYQAPSAMTADLDIPVGLPPQYHMAIVYKGMIFYGSYEAAPEVMERGLDGFGELLTQLERQYGPRARMAAALA